LKDKEQKKEKKKKQQSKKNHCINLSLYTNILHVGLFREDPSQDLHQYIKQMLRIKPTFKSKNRFNPDQKIERFTFYQN